MRPKELSKSRALFLADHRALDFLNTRMRVNEDLVDLLQSDQDVRLWLKQAGFPAPAIDGKTAPLALLHSARSLRESIRSLVEKRKAGRRGDPSILNSFLAASQSYPRLVWNKSSTPTIDTVRRQDTAESILAPVAEAAAELLSHSRLRAGETLRRRKLRTMWLESDKIASSPLVQHGKVWQPSQGRRRVLERHRN